MTAASRGPAFVIFASAKSGTTWLQRLLCAHPQVHCAEPRSFGDHYNPRNISGPHLSVEKFYMFLSAYYHGPVTHDSGPDFYRHMLFDVLDAMIERGRRQSGKPIYGEKVTPFLGTAHAVVDRYHEWRTGIPFVNLVRDPRDVVVSGAVQRTNLRINRDNDSVAVEDLAARRIRDEDLVEFADAWAGAAEAGLAAADRFPHHLDLRYEQVLADQPTHIARLLQFIGAAADAANVSACIEAASFQRLSGGRSRGEEDPRSFYRKATPGDWVNWLTPRQVAIIQSGPRADLMKRLGYDLA